MCIFSNKRDNRRKRRFFGFTDPVFMSINLQDRFIQHQSESQIGSKNIESYNLLLKTSFFVFNKRVVYDLIFIAAQTISAISGGETKVSFSDRGNSFSRGRDSNRGSRDSNRGGFRGGNSGPRELHSAVCSDCGVETQVPFKPTEGRPVYCRDCLPRHRKF